MRTNGGRQKNSCPGSASQGERQKKRPGESTKGRAKEGDREKITKDTGNKSKKKKEEQRGKTSGGKDGRGKAKWERKEGRPEKTYQAGKKSQTFEKPKRNRGSKKTHAPLGKSVVVGNEKPKKGQANKRCGRAGQKK